MRFLKSILLLIGLGAIAALVGCSSSSSSSTNTPSSITPVAGYTATAQVGGSYSTFSATVTNSAGTPLSGVAVTFTATPGATGASGTFMNNTNTETDTTGTNGVATSSTFTAGTVAGAFSVTASVSGVATPATFALTNTAGAAAGLSPTSGNNQSIALGGSYASLVASIVDADGNPVATSGVAVTFTVTAGAVGASGTFTSTSSGVETVNTDANGNATVSDLVANSTAGAFTVAASATGLTSASFNETNTTSTVLSNGNYTFSLSGLDTDDDSLFFVAGTFTVSGGAITGGEQDYVDAANYSNSDNGGQDLINPTGSSITATADGNLQIVLNVCSGTTCTANDTAVGVGGVETINATPRPSNPNQAILTEFDASGSASGQLRQQDTTAAATTPSQGYAFMVSGYDGGEESATSSIQFLDMGGILNVDGAGTISGAGSIFDANDMGGLFPGETLQAGTGTVSAPDAFGRVVFSITPTDSTDFPQISWAGYIVDSSNIYLVETADTYFGTTGGIARSQGANTGTFGTGSVSGSTYGAVMTGFDENGAFQLATEVTFNGGGTASGYMDFNDLVTPEPASPDPVSAPSFTVDPTGRVTISGLTDGTNTINLQLYIDGNGDALALTLDTIDNLGESNLGGQINNSGLTDANFTGNYALFATGWDFDELGEFSAVGPITATGAGDTLSGFTDFNFFGTTTPDEALSGSYTFLAASNGILSPASITGLDVDSSFANTDSFNMYLIGINGTNTGSDGVLIETDTNQLTLGFFEQ